MEDAGGISRKPKARVSTLVRVGAFVVVIVIVTTFVLFAAGKVEWKIVRVNNLVGREYWPFVAADESGSLHMTYYVNGTLIHSAHTEDGWEHSVIAYGSVSGVSPVVFDGAGTPHICYQIEGGNASDLDWNYTVILAKKVSNEWVSSIVTSSSGRGSHSIALDASGNSHIAFFRSSSCVYANNAIGSWTETLLWDASNYSGTVGYRDIFGVTSVAIDESGHPHVAFVRDAYLVGVYSEIDGAWNLTTLDYYGGTYNSVSVDIGVEGTVHVGYWGYAAGSWEHPGLMLATRANGDWLVSPVYEDVSYPYAFRCSVVAASEGVVKIAVELANATGEHLGVWTSGEDGWGYSEAHSFFDLVSTDRAQMSMCLIGDGSTIVPVSRGHAEYATNSLDFTDRLSSVSLIALGSYFIGVVTWITAVKAANLWTSRKRP